MEVLRLGELNDKNNELDFCSIWVLMVECTQAASSFLHTIITTVANIGVCIFFNDHRRHALTDNRLDLTDYSWCIP
jgi:hypothetical protein